MPAESVLRCVPSSPFACPPRSFQRTSESRFLKLIRIFLPLEIEPPIVQGSKGPRGGEWQTSKGQKRFNAGRPSVVQHWYRSHRLRPMAPGTSDELPGESIRTVVLL